MERIRTTGLEQKKRRCAVSSAFLLLAGLLACSAAAGPAIPAGADLAEGILKWREDWPGVRVKVPLKVYRLYLQSRLKPEPLRAPEAPVDWFISRSEYEVRIQGNMLRLRARSDIRLLNPARFRPIRLLPAGIAWRDVEVNGRKKTLREESGWLCLDAAGDRAADGRVKAVTVSAQADLRGEGPHESYAVSIPIPSAAMTRLKVDSDEAWEVRSPRAPVAIVGNQKDGTHGTLGLAAGSRKAVSHLQISWRRPQPPIGRMGRPLYEAWLAWHLDESVQQVRARLNVRIVGGERDSLSLQFPAGADRIRVTGPDVREARVSGRSAVVHLKGAISGATHLSVQFTIPWSAKKGKTSLSGFGISGGRVCGGALVVTSGTGGIVLEEEMTGLNGLGLWEVPTEAASLTTAPAILAYELTGRDWRIAVDVVSLAELPMRETLIDEANYTVLLRPDGGMMTKVHFRVRNRNRQFLELRLPDNLQRIVLARVSEKAVTVSRTPAGRLLIPLDKSVQTVGGGVSFPVEVVLLGRADGLQTRGRLSLLLPCADIPTAQAKCLIYVPEGFEPKDWQGAFRLSEKLTAVVERMEYGRGHVEPEKAERVKVSERERKRLLAYNYFRAAQEAYGRQDFAAAEESARKLITEYADAPQAGEAKKLLDNIALIKGQRRARSRAGRAMAQQLQQSELARTQKAGAQQQEILRKGWEAVREGKEQSAAEAFRAAEEIGRQITVTEAGTRQQKAALGESKKWLAQREAQRGLNIALRAKKERLAAKLSEREKRSEALANINAAEQFLAKDEWLTARDSLNKAVVVTDLLTPEQQKHLAGLYKRVDARMAEQEEAQADAALARERLKEADRAADMPARLDRERVLRTKVALFKKASAEFASGKYKSAMKLCEQLLQHDPENVDARDLWNKAREAIRKRIWAGLREADKTAASEDILKLRSKLVWPSGITQYPDRETWEEIRKEAERIRGRGGAQTPAFDQGAPAANVAAPGRLAMQRVAGKGAAPADERSLAAENVRLQEEIRRLEAGEGARTFFFPGTRPQDLKVPPVGLGFLVEATYDLVAQKRYMEAKELLDKAKKVAAQGAKEKPHAAPRDDVKHRKVVKKDIEAIHEDLDFILALDKESPLESYYRTVEEKWKKAGVNAFNVGDIAQTDAEGRALARFLKDNYVSDVTYSTETYSTTTEGAYVAGYALQDGRAVVTGPPREDVVVYQNGQILVRGRKANEAMAEALENFRKNLGQKVTLNTRSIALKEDTVSALGIRWNDMRDGTWAVIDQGQLNTLLTLEQKELAAGRTFTKGQQEVVPGTATFLPNDARLRLSMARDDSNTFAVNDARVELAHDRILVVASNGRVVVVRAGGTQLWTEAPEAPEIREVPIEITVPPVGVPVRFEKVIVGPEDDLLIECKYKYRASG